MAQAKAKQLTPTQKKRKAELAAAMKKGKQLEAAKAPVAPNPALFGGALVTDATSEFANSPEPEAVKQEKDKLTELASQLAQGADATIEIIDSFIAEAETFHSYLATKKRTGKEIEIEFLAREKFIVMATNLKNEIINKTATILET